MFASLPRGRRYQVRGARAPHAGTPPPPPHTHKIMLYVKQMDELKIVPLTKKKNKGLNSPTGKPYLRHMTVLPPSKAGLYQCQSASMERPLRTISYSYANYHLRCVLSGTCILFMLTFTHLPTLRSCILRGLYSSP